MKESLVIEKPNEIEQQANSQENPTLFLISRLRNNEIFEQLVSLLYEKYYTKINSELEGEELKEKMRLKLKERIQAIENYTPIEMDPDGRESHGGGDYDLFSAHSNGHISRERIKTLSGTDDERFNLSKSVQIQSIFESHEKGHVVRLFPDRYFREYFRLGFDVDSCKYDREKIKEYYIKYKGETPSEDDITTEIAEGKEYLFSAIEIAERMSQLKSYFGMKGNEKFSLEHLTYAREHYVSDTGLDNNMSQFFSAITKETESKFIEIINSSGI